VIDAKMKWVARWEEAVKGAIDVDEGEKGEIQAQGTEGETVETKR